MLKFTEKRLLNIQESFCISIAIAIGVIIYLVFKIEHGYWIPMTTSIMFLAADQGQGAFIKKTRDRVLGTITGALLGFLYVNIFMYANYHWGYMIPLVWFIGFYIYYVTSNYALLAVMITMFVPMLLAAFTSEPLGIGSTLFKRVVCTIIGVSIAIIAEYIIYRRAASTVLSMKKNTNDFFITLSKFIKMSSDHFIDKDAKPGLVIDDSILKCKNLNLLSNKVALKYKNMLQYFDGKTDSCSEELNLILQKIKTSEKFSPTYLFIRSLYVFSILADDLGSAVYRKNFEYKDFYIDDKRYLTEKIYK